jgi:hypothetical protein
MKIGILTFHRAINYGAIFQAYATLTFLKALGHDVEIIDYWPKEHEQEYKLVNFNNFRKRSFLSKAKFVLNTLIAYSRKKKRHEGCLSFIYKEFSLSRNAKHTTGESIVDNYDVVIYGSDQIWRKKNYINHDNGFDKVFWGAYPLNTKKRIAYAASMGIVDSNEEDDVVIKRLLSNFDSISVRETDLKRLIDKMGYESVLCIDPVFLLTKSSWEAIIPKAFSIKDKYILFYHHSFSQDALSLVKDLAKQMKCRIIEVNSTVIPTAFGKRYFNTAQPGEFLGLFRDAEFVVTTSFHGTAYSVLMEKQFYALGMGHNSQRSRTLLDYAGLSDRYIDDLDHLCELDINYTEVNNSIEPIIEASKQFLKHHSQS